MFHSPLLNFVRGTKGKFFEVNDSGRLIWEYINPVNGNEIANQGDTIGANFVFRCTRYDKDYAAFKGRDIRTLGYIEKGSKFSCIALQNDEIENEVAFSVYPNPANSRISIQSEFSPQKIRLYNSLGMLVFETDNSEKYQSISTQTLADGMYFLHIEWMDGRIHSERLAIQH